MERKKRFREREKGEIENKEKAFFMGLSAEIDDAFTKRKQALVLKKIAKIL